MSEARVPTQIMVEGAGVDIAVHDYGGDDGLTPMVLVHGIRDLAWSMDSIAQALTDRYRVLAVDLRGHGDSDNPGSYSQPHYVADLREVLSRLDVGPVILVGHSLGGQVVCRFAALFPEHALAVVTVEGLGPPMHPEESHEDGMRRFARQRVEMLAQLPREGRRMADVQEAVQRVRAKHHDLSPERARFLAEKGTQALPDGGVGWKWDPHVQSTWASVTREDSENHWSWIECPVLVVTAGRAGDFWRDRRGMAGDDDRLAGLELERRLACFRDVQHVEITDAGHMVHFDAPEELNEAIDAFLAALDTREPATP
jgi:pimeloyl-ACP methyl ester carboxylesterase